MPIDMKACFKKIKTLFITLVGWFVLFYLWYKMMFSLTGLKLSLVTLKNISIFAVFLLILYFLLCSLNIDRLVQIVFNKNFIRYKIKAFSWVEITYDNNDNIVNIKKRRVIICHKKDLNLSASKKLSYSAILIRDGHIKEAIGFLRQLQYDPYAGQLARKIADSELNLLFNDLSIINNLKEHHE